MALFRRDTPDASPAPDAIVASGVRVRVTTSTEMQLVAGNQQAWQAEAWDYRDKIPELRFATKYRANAIGRVTIMAALIVDGEDEPVPLSVRRDRDDNGQPTDRAQLIDIPEDLCQAAEAELARLPLDAGYSFLGVFSENFDVAGECWLHGYTDPATGRERWDIRAVDELTAQGKNATLTDPMGRPRTLDLGTDNEPGSEELYRLWTPHPRRQHLADSSIRALLSVLRTIELIEREMRAVSRSRIASNGILKVPDGLLGARNTLPDDQMTPSERFSTDLATAMVAPIANEGDAGAVAPVAVFGKKEDLEGLDHLTLDRADSKELAVKLERALTRLGTGIELPPEILNGLGDTNHWSAWAIDTSTFRHYLEPSTRAMVDALTEAFLRASLLRAGYPADLVRRVRAWYDASTLTENANRRVDTLDAIDRMLISPRAGRDGLGFSEQDAPTLDEIIQMIAAKQGFDQATAAAVLAQAARRDGIDVPPLPDIGAGAGAGVGSSTTVADPAAPSTPQTAPAGIAAAAAPEAGWRLDLDTGRDLIDIDRALMLALQQAADHAIQQALQTAGSRLRAKATRDPATHTALRHIPVTEWAARLQRERLAQLDANPAFLLAGAWENLRGLFAKWVTAAAAEIALKIGALTPERGRKAVEQRITATITARIDDGWALLETELTRIAEQRLFDTATNTTPGEGVSGVVPARVIRAALAAIGGDDTAGPGDTARGGPLAGLATGRTAMLELATTGAITVGYQWSYGPALRDVFKPHKQLDGLRFTSWDDPALETDIDTNWVGPHFHPGDHLGCGCYAVPAFAIPDQPPRDTLNNSGGAARIQALFIGGTP